MKISSVALALIGATLVVFSACKKERCTNSKSYTYQANFDMEPDENGCEYSNLVFFMTADSLYKSSDTTYTYDTATTYNTVIVSIDSVTQDTTFATDTLITIDTTFDITKIYTPFDSTVLPLIVNFDGKLVDTIFTAAPIFPNNCDTSLPHSMYVHVKLADGDAHTWVGVSLYKNRVFTGNIQANPAMRCIPVQIE